MYHPKQSSSASAVRLLVSPAQPASPPYQVKENEWRRPRAATLAATKTHWCPSLRLEPTASMREASIDVVRLVCANQRLPDSRVTMSVRKRGIRLRIGCGRRPRTQRGPRAISFMLRVCLPSPCLCSMVPFVQHVLAKLCGRRSGACKQWRRQGGKADDGGKQRCRGRSDAIFGDD
jgi:hypothetical protein